MRTLVPLTMQPAGADLHRLGVQELDPDVAQDAHRGLVDRAAPRRRPAVRSGRSGLTGMRQGIWSMTAILAPRVSVIVDEDGRRILRQWHTRRAGPLQRATPFATLAEVVVETDEGDSETTPAVRLRVLRKGGRSPVTLLTRPLSALPEVTALANRLRGALQP
jgi:hypothetical protein